MQRGAIILCGGQSTRMGHDKASLPFGNESMLERVTRIVSHGVARENIVVVPAPHQQLRPPAQVTIARDAIAHRGPLAGLATGLRALQEKCPRIDSVFVTGCDLPLLVPGLIEYMFAVLGDFDAAVPFDGTYRYPLAATYHPRILSAVDALLSADRFRAQDLFQEINARDIRLDDLCTVDPQLHSLRNVNTLADYSDAVTIAGWTTLGASNDWSDT